MKQYTKDGQIKYANCIVVIKDGMQIINPTEEQILADGWVEKVKQKHTVLEIYPPSLDTASLYEVIDETHAGTLEDPIPYNPPMELFNGKYYTQNDVLYLCNRDSGISLTHDLSELINLYVVLA